MPRHKLATMSPSSLLHAGFSSPRVLRDSWPSSRRSNSSPPYDAAAIESPPHQPLAAVGIGHRSVRLDIPIYHPASVCGLKIGLIRWSAPRGEAIRPD